MIVNLFDAAFAHHPASSVHGKKSKHITWTRNKLNWPGVTVITDDMLCQSRVLDVLESKVKIGWLMECREYRPDNYRRAEALLDKIDLLLTHDADLLGRFPEKCRFVPFGGVWIARENWGMHVKTRQTSMIYSAKAFMRGHRMRHAVADMISGIDLYGHGSTTPVTFKETALQPYRFSVVIENSRASNYFTEKLLDCFALGTIPIYWGCPNVDRWFNPDGIITFDRVADLPLILEGCEYSRHEKAAMENLRRVEEFEVTEDFAYQHILRELE